MSQLRALVWLKWTLFLNSLRSRRAAAGRVAAALVTLLALVLSSLLALALGVAAYAVTTSAKPLLQQVALCGMLFFIYFMWAMVPLGTSGADRFDPGRLLLYPISLRKLFAVDFLSELVSLPTIFAVPAILAVAVGAGVSRGALWRALLAGLLGVACGLGLVKLVAISVGALMRKGRTRGETLVALIGVSTGFGGVLAGQLLPRLARLEALPWYIRWTPPGVFAAALTDGLRPGAHFAYLSALALLSLFTVAAIALTYRAAARAALQANGGGAVRSKGGRRPAKRAAAGWQLPLLAAETAAVVEKEIRYALRNAQLRALAVTPLILTITFRLLRTEQEQGTIHPTPLGAVSEGAGAAGSLFYIFLVLTAFTCNQFGQDGAGMRSFVLAPAARRRILLGKNIAATLIALSFAALVLFFQALFFRDLTPRALLFAGLCFVFFAATFAVAGNELSIRFPKRIEYGKRLNPSGIVGLLLIPLLVMVALPPVVAVAAGYFTGRPAVRYVTMAAFATLSVILYLLLLGRQGRTLQAREQQLLEAVTAEGGG